MNQRTTANNNAAEDRANIHEGNPPRPHFDAEGYNRQVQDALNDHSPAGLQRLKDLRKQHPHALAQGGPTPGGP